MARREPFLRGMALPLFDLTRVPASYEAELDEIAALNVDTVALVVTLRQRSTRSRAVEPESPLLPGLVTAVAARAHALGMRVALFPLVVVEEIGPGRWRGSLQPPSWDEWFAGYGAAIRRLAVLCQQSRIELLVVGAELVSSEPRTDSWRELIRSVRGVYGGKLTYSSNWDALTNSAFVDDLDYLGCNAYAWLSSARTAREVADSWLSFQHAVVRWHQRWERPVLLMELGFPSLEGSCARGWDYLRPGRADPLQQATCFRAFFDAWRGQPYLLGLFVYAWYGQGGPADRTYTPRGKPAAAVIASSYAEWN